MGMVGIGLLLLLRRGLAVLGRWKRCEKVQIRYLLILEGRLTGKTERKLPEHR